MCKVARSPRRAEGLNQRRIGELVARALQEQHRQHHLGEVLSRVRPTARRPDAAESRGRRCRRHRASGADACACDVMRPPNDLPPATSGSAGHSRAASRRRRAPRHARAFGDPAAFEPRSM
jgi:hypothetical protein